MAKNDSFTETKIDDLAINDTGVDPSTAGEIRRVGPDILIHTGGTIQNLTEAGKTVAVSEGGQSLVTDVEDIDFGDNVSATDDGDGTVSVSATDTDTDTHADVSDDGSSILGDVTDINFGTALDVQTDGDGSVTIDGSDISTDTDTHTNVSDSGSVVVDGVDDINFGSDISVSNDGDNTVTVSPTPVPAIEGHGSPIDIDISGDASTVDGANVFVQSSEPSGGSEGDIWVRT